MDYILLDICQAYGLNPVKDFDPLPEELKIQMIAKWHLDREWNARQPRFNV